MGGKPRRDDLVYVGLRVTPEFKAWLERLAASERTNISQVLDKGVARYAESLGFEAAPAR
jgi:hypothetical protein